MIYKVALCEIAPLDISGFSQETHFIKTASGKKISVNPGSDKAKVIQAEIKKHPTALFFRSKAIVADLPNTNGDYFSEEEILDSYKSFEGVPFFTNHDNQNVENARGKIIFAEYVPEEKAVYTISFVDREAFPHICRSIEEEYVTGVSMGCSVEYSVCNICGNKAEKVDDYCSHIRNRKGRRFTGTAKDVRTGEAKQFKNEIVFEFNYGIKFIELSAVVDPAEPSCRIQGIYSNDEFVRKVANLQNNLYMIRHAAIGKEAGQQELEQLNQTLSTLEDIAVQLVKNRQQIEVDFASDLVKILSELQTFVDELTAAGFGQMESIPGVADEQEGFEGQAEGLEGMEGDMGLGTPEGDMGMGAPQGGVPQGVTPTPVSATQQAPAGGSAGVQSTGVSNRPASPQLPIIQPRAFNLNGLKKAASVISGLVDLRDRIYEQVGEEDMGKRRTLAARKDQKREAIKILSNSWQEKQDFFEYIKQVPSIENNNGRLSVSKKDESFIILAEAQDSQNVWTYEDLTEEERELIKSSPEDAAIHLLESFSSNAFGNKKKGAEKMAHKDVKITEAGATSVNKEPEVTQEVQLEENRELYHPRTGEEKHSTQEKQLEELRTGEPEVITEKQLEDANLDLHPRTGQYPEVTEEVQLAEDNSGASPRKEEDKHSVTQKQLETEGYKTGNEPEVITEKQLNDVDAPWSRAAKRDASMFKSASEHMDEVLKTVAETVIETGCTPEEACDCASGMVGTIKGRYELATAILEDDDSEKVNVKERLAFWSGKNLKVATAGSKEIQQSLVSGLRRVASDVTINPDTVIEAVDVISEEGSEAVAEKVNEMVEETKETKEAKVSVKNELRTALKKSKQSREAEREEWEKKDSEESEESKPDTMIELSFDEAGLEKDAPRDDEFKSTLASFAKGALASQNIKLASITNVTIDGDTISIAVQTDDSEESVEIPVGGAALEAEVPEEEVVPEADIAGEALEGALPEQGAYASKNSKMTKEAQQFGGMGGPVPGGESGGVATDVPDGMPGAGEPVQTLTEGEPAAEEDIPTVGEQQVPYGICPECGSNDVDVENKDGDISGNCNNCGAEYEALIKKTVEFKIIKPTKSAGEDGGEVPEVPEVPALPVAAQTKIGKDSLVRIAANKAKFGHVCPACGNQHCTASVDEDGSSEYSCEACGTDVKKDILIDVSDPDNTYQRVKWDIRPDFDNCEGCKEAAQKLASLMKIEQIMKSASAEDYPVANCKELIAKKFGGNTTATSGPCKGKLLTECVCAMLEKMAWKSERHLVRVAEASMQEDPMDSCVEKQMKDRGFSRKEAQLACNCLKKTYAAKGQDNFFVMAFAEDIEKGIEKDLNMIDLGTINDILTTETEEETTEFMDRSFEEALKDIEDAKKVEAEKADDNIKVEASEFEIEVEVEKDDDDEKEDKDEKKDDKKSEDKEEKDEKEDKDDDDEKEDKEAQAESAIEVTADKSEEEEKEMALAMQTHKLRRVGEEVVKVAGVPTQVETIEGNVEAGVPRADATIRDEESCNCKKPQVPRADATMGQEEPCNCEKPNVPVDSSYMGQEKKMQEGMPAINNEIKGTVIAEDAKTVKEAKQLKEVDTVEGDVEAGVPRADATIGEEEKFTADDPQVPRSDATMGQEESVSEKGPDVPVDNAYMGQEKQVQSDMPGINDEMLKQVQMKKEVQLERIATARKMEAIKVASKLVATSRIPEVAYDDVVEALSSFELDNIPVVAERMYPAPKPQTKTASTEAPSVTAGTHTVPAIVMETKAPETQESLTDKIAKHFTIGSRDFDRKLAENDLK